MTRLFAFVVIALSLCLSAPAQDSGTEVVLPDIVMKQAVQRIVIEHFKSERGRKEILFSERGIRLEWLPKMKDLKFTVVSDAERRKITQEVHFFGTPRLADGEYEIDFGWGDPDCDASGDTWRFRLVGDQIRGPVRAIIGWGMGCSGSVSGNPDSSEFASFVSTAKILKGRFVDSE